MTMRSQTRPPEKDDDAPDDVADDQSVAEDEGPKPVIGTPSVTPPEPQVVPTSEPEAAPESFTMRQGQLLATPVPAGTGRVRVRVRDDQGRVSLDQDVVLSNL